MLFQGGLCAACKGQAAMLELTARGLGGSCREGCAGKGQASTLEAAKAGRPEGFGCCREGCRWKLPRGSWRVLRVLSLPFEAWQTAG